MRYLTRTEIRALQPYRGRGLRQLRNRIGDLPTRVNAFLALHKHMRILEVGCGFGTALLELRRLGGDRVELHGINKRAEEGDWEAVLESARQNRIVSPGTLAMLTPPFLHFADVDRGLPFPTDYFDLVYSQVSFFYYEQKAFFLEEVNRVISSRGTALLDVQIDRPTIPPEYRSCIEIWQGARRIPFWHYIRAFSQLRRRRGERQPYLEIKKGLPLDLRLDFAHAIRLHDICPDWWGQKSIYRVRS